MNIKFQGFFIKTCLALLMILGSVLYTPCLCSAADLVVGARHAGQGTRLHKTLTMIERYSLAFVSGKTDGNFTINANALTHTIVLEMPSFSGANPTATLSIENPDSNEIYSNSGMAENTDHVMTTEKPLVGDNTIKVTLSEDPLSDGIAYVTVYLRGE